MLSQICRRSCYQSNFSKACKCWRGASWETSSSLSSLLTESFLCLKVSLSYVNFRGHVRRILRQTLSILCQTLTVQWSRWSRGRRIQRALDLQLWSIFGFSPVSSAEDTVSAACPGTRRTRYLSHRTTFFVFVWITSVDILHHSLNGRNHANMLYSGDHTEFRFHDVSVFV